MRGHIRESVSFIRERWNSILENDMYQQEVRDCVRACQQFRSTVEAFDECFSINRDRILMVFSDEWISRKYLEMAWGLYNTLESENAIEVLEKAIEMNGAPEIINSDQGSQYTSEKWMESCSKYKSMRISMDGRARCLDNIWIERFWRTIKQEYIYLNPVDGVTELREGIGKYIEYYNKKRPHQGIEHKVPYEMYSAA